METFTAICDDLHPALTPQNIVLGQFQERIPEVINSTRDSVTSELVHHLVNNTGVTVRRRCSSRTTTTSFVELQADVWLLPHKLNVGTTEAAEIPGEHIKSCDWSVKCYAAVDR